MFFHQSRNVRTLTSPARAGLRFLSFRYAGSPRSQNGAHVFHSMMVSARCVIFPRKGIARPQNHHIGALGQHVYRVRTIKFALESSVCRLPPCFVFARKIAGKLRVVGNDSLHLHLSIIEDTHHLSPAFEQRRDQQSKDKDDNHRAAEEHPALPTF